MSEKKPKGVNKHLETFINKMMKEAEDNKEMSLLDKLRVVDRALALEKIKLKISDDEWGSGFLDPDGTEEEA